VSTTAREEAVVSGGGSCSSGSGRRSEPQGGVRIAQTGEYPPRPQPAAARVPSSMFASLPCG